MQKMLESKISSILFYSKVTIHSRNSQEASIPSPRIILYNRDREK